MRCCAGMTSSRSDFSSPITCIAPPQQGHDVVSGSMTTSTRGRCAGSDLRLPGSDLGRGAGACFSAAACLCALAMSRSSSASCSWSGSSRSECRPNCARWNCRMSWRIRSTRRSSSSRSAISASAAARRPGMSPGSASAVVIAARVRPYSGSLGAFLRPPLHSAAALIASPAAARSAVRAPASSRAPRPRLPAAPATGA
jgi:hypothetical protein